ncbi:MAG: hypothetical protein U1E17_01285 [Geminicoccaceae bacterium]
MLAAFLSSSSKPPGTMSFTPIFLVIIGVSMRPPRSNAMTCGNSPL